MEALLISINKRTFVVCERDERVDEGRGRNAAGRSGRGEAVSGGDHPQDHEGDRRPGQVQEDLRQGMLSLHRRKYKHNFSDLYYKLLCLKAPRAGLYLACMWLPQYPIPTVVGTSEHF